MGATRHDIGEKTKHEIALGALHDYLIWLRDHGDKSDEFRCYGHSRKSQEDSARKKETKLPISMVNETSSLVQTITNQWISEKEAEWKSKGSINSYGYLRVSQDKSKWTLSQILAAWPKLNQYDGLSILYILDGTITEAEMSETANLRAVIDEIVELKLVRIFNDVLKDEKKQSRYAASLQPLNYRETSKTDSKRKKQSEDLEFKDPVVEA